MPLPVYSRLVARRWECALDSLRQWRIIPGMKNEDFDKLTASIREAGEIKAGRLAPSRVYEVRPPAIKKVRAKLAMSQGEFAAMIGVSTRTLQNWEQGRREPEGPAKALLRVAARNPRAVRAALHAK